MQSDLITAFTNLKPHVQIIVILCFLVVCLSVLIYSAPAIAIITALAGLAGYVQAKHNGAVLATVVNRMNAKTPPEDQTFDPQSLLKAAKNGESRLTSPQEH